MKRKTTNPLNLVLFALFVLPFFSSCSQYPGFELCDSGIYRRLEQFGDCSPALIDAEFFVMQVEYRNATEPDTGYTFTLHHQNINIKNEGESPIGLRLMEELKEMNCGDKISLVLPFSEFDDTYLGAFADSTIYPLEEDVVITLYLQKTFTEKEYRSYLMSMAQLEEMSETDAIHLFLINRPQIPYEKHGDCYIQFEKRLGGNGIQSGKIVSLEWNTYLFNGEKLDTTTQMQFVFGKPGQLVDGFQYGLSFLSEGDEATIFLPSYLAFGESGSTSGIVPPRTPVFFKVRVLRVSEDITT